MIVTSGAVNMALASIRENYRMEVYKNDPVKWAKEVLGVHLWSKQREIVYSVANNKRTTVRSSNGTGKDLPLDTPLPTPTGWTTMGEVQVGDQLLDEMGRPTTVTFKSDIMRNPLYEVVFGDGSRQVASGTHEWNTIDFRTINRYRRRNGHATYTSIEDYRDLWDLSETRTTETIRETLMCGKFKNHYVPVNKPFDLPEKDLPIDPYVLGVWLGDGTSVSMSLSLGDTKTHIPDEFRRRGVIVHEKDLGLSYTHYTFSELGGARRLRDLGLYRNKHIPMQYLRASYQQRLDLLRGLMDTDGFYLGSSRGKNTTGVGIDFMDEQLAEGTVELIRSLGARCSISKERTYLNGKDAGPRWRMVFNPTFDPFTPGSHKSLQRPEAGAQQSRKTVRTIVSVAPVETVPTACVQVDSPRHLYLAGKDMIPTHNTMVAGVLAAWWIAVHYNESPDQTIVVTTAPSFPQIRTNLFAEMKMELSRSHDPKYPDGTNKGDSYLPLPGVINSSGNTAEWKDAQGNLLAIGRKPAEGDVITTFAGIHRRNVLFIIDEGGGVSPDMFVSAERLTTNRNAKIVVVGNPDRRGSQFYKTFYDPDESERWNKITISAYDTPAFTGEPCPSELLEYMPDPKWVESNLKAWGGRDDPRAKIAIFGEFPDEDESVFFSETALNRAEDTTIQEDPAQAPILGVDLAMHGMDRSVIYSNNNGHIRLVDSWGKASATENARRALDAIALTGADYVNIDSGGIGTPIIERIIELNEEDPDYQLDFNVTMMNSSEASDDPRRWYNKRAQWYDQLREGMQLGKVDLVFDQQTAETEFDGTRKRDNLRKQFTDINYNIVDKGARAGSILMESKKDMKARVGYSPDDIDAIVYAYYEPTKKAIAPQSKVYSDPADILGDDMPGYLNHIETIWEVVY